jgi:NADH-quinone oxidoreductase subunit L
MDDHKHDHDSHDHGAGHGHGGHDDHGHGHGHDDHGHGAGGHDDHGHGGGGHGGHHGEHHEYAWWEYVAWSVALFAALCAGVWAVQTVSGTPPGSNAEWLTIHTAAGTLLVLPLIAFAAQMFFGRFIGRPAHWISLSAIFIACVLATWIFTTMLRGDTGSTVATKSVEWFRVGNIKFNFGFYIDGLTASMLFIVTFIGGLVHLYSTSYMEGDPRYPRFFGFLSIFCFSMLGLVLSDNLLGLYIFWELVGLSSYLLIGFWFEKQSAADACKKAFLTNRVGDIGFFFGLAAIFQWTGSLGYTEIFERMATMLGTPADPGPLAVLTEPWLGLSWMPTPLTICGVLLFCGAIGKSAQFPLHIWLPDAMEGPTPVSALIHAATMVAAGVFMVGRLYPLFTPGALTFIAYTGLITAVFAGTIAIAQYDIKRVLAYSTVSQLGYMIAALGVGGYTAGLFHLSTHAFFKALLFLCSGAVIHAVHTQDMREMGGLWQKIPWTCAAMTIGTLAICGLPFTSGFYSKEAILQSMYEFGHAAPQHWGIFWLALIAAGVTAFYSFRLVIMTFMGEPRDRAKYDAAHESPPAMVVPLVLLSVMSIMSAYGFLGEGELNKAKWANASVGAAENRQSVAKEHYGAWLAMKWGKWFPGVMQRPDQNPNGPEKGMPVVAFFEAKTTSGAEAYSYDWPGNGKKEAAAHGNAHGAKDAHGHEAQHVGAPEEKGSHGAAHHAPHVPVWLPVGVVFLSIAFSFVCFYFKIVTIEGIERDLPPAGMVLRKVQTVLANKYFIDEIYGLIFISPFMFLTRCLWTFDATVIDGIVNGSATVFKHVAAISGRVDLYVVDGIANGLADATVEVGNQIRKFQGGVVQDYLVVSFWVVVLALLGLQLIGG